MLSGGQQQLLCLARALAVEPEVLLLDEPTSSLAPRSAARIEELIAGLKDKMTVVFVTHNVPEAVRLGDRVILLSERPGRIIAEHAIDVPRPRRTDAGEFAELAAAITADLQGQRGS